MENDPPSKRDRLMGRLFGGKEKERKPVASHDANNLDAFLRSSADNLNVTHAPPPPPPQTAIPKLTKLDTTTVSRYPQALGMNQQAQQNRPMAPPRNEARSYQRSPRPNKKGLIVRFTDTYPDVIGEGGDECENPTMEIGKNKKPKLPPAPPPHRSPMLSQVQPVSPAMPPPPPAAAVGVTTSPDDDFTPKPLSRTQTGFSSIYEPESDEETLPPPPIPAPRIQPPPAEQRKPLGPETVVPGKTSSARFLDTAGSHDENRRSFIEIRGGKMREDEGAAFVKAARTPSAASEHDWVDGDKVPSDPSDHGSPELGSHEAISPESSMEQLPVDYSPAGSVHSIGSGNSNSYATTKDARSQPQVNFPMRHKSLAVHREPPMHVAQPARSASVRLQAAVSSPDEDSLIAFISRTKHLYELFRLHAETISPISACAPRDCARAALWWFLRGRMGLETSIRERPGSPQSQMQNDLDKQQAYTNLAKGYWLCEEVIPDISGDPMSSSDPEIAEVRLGLITALTKMTISMKRNGFLPPEDAFLPQTIDKSIWIEYPQLSQDMVALLSGNWGSGMSAMQHPMSTLHLMDAFPINDTQENFSYGRVSADVFLMEQGRESQRLLFPCLLSIVRPQKHSGLVFVIASQNGHVQLAIQESKNSGPVWDDVRWRNESCTLEIRLPRGFMLIVQLMQQDFRMLWNMYDFGAKMKSTLYPRSNELVVFRNTLRAFQYLDSDPQSRVFPKEAVPQCDVVLLERIDKEVGPLGPRSWHRGFRIAVVTGPRTRTLSGVNHSYPPFLPIQFGFFRGEGDAPALSLKYESGRQKGRMVLSFNDDKERVHFHSLLTGTALDHDERIFADVQLKSFSVSQSLREPQGMAPFNRMPWKASRVVNDEFSPTGSQPPTVLADKLKVVLEYQNGTITDRVNVASGELRVRLEVNNAKILRVLRQPQNDITMSVSEAQVPKELPRNLADALQLLKMNSTIRSMEFNSLKDLHDFQAALTGYEVIFDALASTFAIARRRMVVPIHKKWEAGYTRIQVVKQDDKLQLLAFFADFQHGHCMNFVLKGTDVYESIGRGNKAGIKFVDAKFPLPGLPADKDGDFDEMAFVCLDLPDLPGEHDDISIIFEDEAGMLTARGGVKRCVVLTMFQIEKDLPGAFRPLSKGLREYQDLSKKPILSPCRNGGNIMKLERRVATVEAQLVLVLVLVVATEGCWYLCLTIDDVHGVKGVGLVFVCLYSMTALGEACIRDSESILVDATGVADDHGVWALETKHYSTLLGRSKSIYSY